MMGWGLSTKGLLCPIARESPCFHPGPVQASALWDQGRRTDSGARPVLTQRLCLPPSAPQGLVRTTCLAYLPFPGPSRICCSPSAPRRLQEAVGPGKHPKQHLQLAAVPASFLAWRRPGSELQPSECQPPSFYFLKENKPSGLPRFYQQPENSTGDPGPERQLASSNPAQPPQGALGSGRCWLWAGRSGQPPHPRPPQTPSLVPEAPRCWCGQRAKGRLMRAFHKWGVAVTVADEGNFSSMQCWAPSSGDGRGWGFCPPLFCGDSFLSSRCPGWRRSG